jgi:hypothetical protein
MGAGRCGVTIGSNMIELLTPSALGRHSTRLIRFYCYFYVTEMVQLGNFEALWGIVKVNDMHGERGSVTPGSHRNNILDTET